QEHRVRRPRQAPHRPRGPVPPQLLRSGPRGIHVPRGINAPLLNSKRPEAAYTRTRPPSFSRSLDQQVVLKNVRKSKKSCEFVVPSWLKSALPPKNAVWKSKKSCDVTEPE